MYEELNELLLRARIGEVKSKEKILNELTPLIISSIRRYYNKFSDYEDLIQEGRIVILDCINSFDESKGTYFLGYVKTMLKFYYLNKHKEKITTSLNEKVGNDEEEELIDLLKSEVNDPLELLVKLEERNLLVQALSNLTLRQREIIIDFYYDNLTIGEISKKFGISYRTVVNTKTAALNKLRMQVIGNRQN